MLRARDRVAEGAESDVGARERRAEGSLPGGNCLLEEPRKAVCRRCCAWQGWGRRRTGHA